MSEPKRFLNLGCGNSPIISTEEVQVINVDASCKGELIINFDITSVPYPFTAEQFDRIYLFHTIEHIPEEDHGPLLTELRRIIKEEGELVLAYPEFTKVATNYIDNKDSNRDFWKLAIYGRGLTDWDRHKALMDTEEFSKRVIQFGWTVIGAVPEKNQDFNTIAVLRKSPYPATYETIMGAEFNV